jgi:DNA-directed RNA polymerase specialized sigma24 family protein
MLPVRMDDSEDSVYLENLDLVRRRILGFVQRRLVPHYADFAQAEDIAQACIVTLWEKYPEKRDIGEMVGISIGIARNKLAQFGREREQRPGISDSAADRRESIEPRNPHSGERMFEQLAARQHIDALLLALLKLSPRCRQLLTLKLIEQRSYPEIRMIMSISGNIYEMAKRCHLALLRMSGGIGL